ncbi:lactate racemase [Anaerolineae bacterium]|nr:lactate racemase [Anaerolineae bacterium]
MHIKLAYGKTGMEIDLPDTWDVTVVEPRFVPGLGDPHEAIRQALRAPIGATSLRDQAKPTDKVGIVFSDITRPTPNHLMLPAVLSELTHVPKENITLFNALGTHRPNTPDELRAMLGDALVADYRLVQNDAFDPSTQVNVGVSARGHDVWLNRELMACDVKVLTGFIEPHFFAGFSGGGKAVMPGMAGQRTVLGNHDATMIANPNATWGVTQGNPIWEEITEVASKAGKKFLINVTLNKHKEITGVFAGDLRAAHAAGCAFVKQTAMVAVRRAFDIVITSNSGYPLDLNLYQAVKGMSAAAQVVKTGGAIIIAADCWDGIPNHGLYGKLLREASSPRDLLDKICSPGFLEQDQWQAQIQAQIQLKAQVFVRSDNLTDAQIEAALLHPCHRIEETVSELMARFGTQASICVLPEGPQTIPYVQTT